MSEKSDLKKEEKAREKDALRITDQFRAKRAMVYEFKCETAKLAVQISPREAASDPDEWRVEARASHDKEASFIAEWGPTRTDALSKVSQAWISQTDTLGLPVFDWEGVVKALAAVRAL